MPRWIAESFIFLWWLGVIQLGRLIAVLFCAAEVIGVLALWGQAFAKASAQGRMIWFWIPVAATFALAVQIALWQFAWLRIAQRGGHWRAIAECFSRAVRYPVVRLPHPWE